MPVTIFGPKSKLKTYALLDEGSTITLIDAKTAREIGARGPKVSLSLIGIASSDPVTFASEKVDISISGVTTTLKLSDVHTVENLTLPSQTLEKKLIDENPHLRETDIKYYNNAVPTILLGQDNIHAFVSKKSRGAGQGLPFVSKTPLGWVAHGRASRKAANNVRQIFCISREGDEGTDASSDIDMHQLVREYFKLEAIGIGTQERETKSEKRAQEILDKTTRKTGDLWETGLIWKDDNIQLPESQANALRRLKSVEARLDRDNQYAVLYYAEMSRLFDCGYAEKVSDIATEEPTWYLPHFGVTNPNKPGRVRLVFDAAAKSENVSLNDCLLKGPDLLQSLWGVIMRFRIGKIAYKGDIRDMFLRVKLSEKDRNAQRFLWRGKDRKNPPEVFQMTTLLFGSKASPCSALFVKNKNAETYGTSHSTVTTKIVRQSYMDDFLDSCDSVEEANTIIETVREINKKGGFQMHGWACSHESVLENIPEGERSGTNKKLREFDQASKEKVLGLRWDTQTDTFNFELGENLVPGDILSGSRKPTKREFLRIIMSVFDPLGFLAPLLIRSKILMQQIWISGVEWDEQIRDEEHISWRSWIADIQTVNDVQIPRCYSKYRESGTRIELHIFCDASTKAYAAVAYVRFGDENTEAEIAFVAAKSRVAPLKPTSIPRLELQGALIACRLARAIETEHDFRFVKRVFWTDSRTVLAWINSDARRYQTFVSHRLAEIGELSTPAEWKWVPSALNVADDATRIIEYNDGKKDRWLIGPDFLKNEESFWPTLQPQQTREELSVSEDETKKNFVGVVAVKSIPNLSIPDFARFSSWLRLLHATARLLVAVERWKGESGHVSEIHVRKAQNLRIRAMQAVSFAAELRALTVNREIDRKSKILKLSPYIDNEGILRVRGRTRITDGIECTSEPAILDGSHLETRLLIKYYHVKMNHGSHETVVNEIRQRFWISKLRVKLRSIVASCVTCRLIRAKPKPPVMADLSSSRVAHSLRSFSHCGVDYFGPMQVKIGRRREKRWGVLFTCLTTRAVHLELAHTLSADSAIMAIRRLAARRGQPVAMYSDNGTNFRGAAVELREAVLELDENAFQRYATKERMIWKFIPPSAPHMGGAWERLIRSIKSALAVVLKEQAPREETLITIFTEVEHIVNSRPLTHVSPDPRDEEALTPNHFLIGSSSGQLALSRFAVGETNLTKQWRWIQTVADAFWKRWLREYLPSLLPRTKWLRESENLREGDLVLVVDELSSRNAWRKGVIEQVFPGKDGRVRVVKIRTVGGIVKRPAAKVIRFAREGDR